MMRLRGEKESTNRFDGSICHRALLRQGEEIDVKRWTIFYLLLVGSIGCSHLGIQTDNRVRVDTPVEAVVRLPHHPDPGPLQAVIVPYAGGHEADTSTENQTKKAFVEKRLRRIRPAVAIPQVGTSGTACTGAKVALIDIDGPLFPTPNAGLMGVVSESPVALFREKLDAAAADASVRAVVLRINSPGGGVTAADLMRRELLRFRLQTGKPVLACLMDVGTGGAYWLASASDRILATPTTVTGGLGVILNLFNLRDLMAQFNIIPQEIKAGAYADLGTPARALTPEGKRILQTMADEFQQRILTEVCQARPKVRLDDIADGRIFTATQALQIGLIDEVGDLAEGLRQAQAWIGADGHGRAAVVMYRRAGEPAHSIYATATWNVPAIGLGLNLPGLDRARLPTFLSMWQAELNLEHHAGR